jgi:P4 family phage/plasmid primase-like protien
MDVQNLRNLLNRNVKCARVQPLKKVPFEAGWNTGDIDFTLDNVLPNTNYIILTGQVNNIIVIDYDLQKPGLYTLEHKQQLIDAHDTLIVSTPSGGLHIYYQYDFRFDEWKSLTGLLGGNVDIRSNKAGIVGPGSKTEKGEYHIIKEKPIIYMPDNLYDELEGDFAVKISHKSKRKNRNLQCNEDLPIQIHEKLTELGYTNIEYKKNNYGSLDFDYNHTGFKCKICDIEHERINSYIYRNYRGYWLGCYSNRADIEKNTVLLYNDNNIGKDADSLLDSLGETNISNQLVKMCKGKLLVYEGKIYEWNGVYWQDYKILGGTYQFINNELKEFYMSLYNNLIKKYKIPEKKGEGMDDHTIDVYVKLKKALAIINDFGNTKLQNNIIIQFKNNKEINFTGKWNANPDLFAFNNCIWNLETKSFTTPDPSDYINLTCGYDYNEPTIETMDFIKTIIRDINYNDDCYRYIMTVFSSMLYRINIREFIYFFTGTGGNGKGLLTEMCKTMFGNYASNLPLSYYTTPTKSGANAELCAVREARFIWTSETEATGNQQSIFFDAPLKTLTGGDEINCRPLYSNSIIKFVAGTPVVLTNTLPKFTNMDDSHKRRIKVIQLPWSYVEHVSEHLSVTNGGVQKLRVSELKGKLMKPIYKCGLFKILAQEFYPGRSKEIPLPKYILDSTNEYFDSNDALGKFLRTVLVYDKDGKVSNDQLWVLYNRYVGAITKDNFCKSLKKHNSNYPNKRIKIDDDKQVRGIAGYKLNTDAINQLEEERNAVNNTQDILDV